MIKKKYIYNQKTLSYEVFKPGRKTYFLQAGLFAVLSISLAILFSFTYSIFFDTAKEAQLKQKNTILSNQIVKISTEVDSIHTCLNEVQEKDDELYRLLLGKPALADEVRLAGVGGSKNIFSSNDLFVLSQHEIDRLQAKLAVQNSSFDALTPIAIKVVDKLNSQPKILPIRENELIRFASGFGNRIHPIYKINKFHKGIDLTASRGTAVYSTAPGIVLIAANYHDGYGNKVVINHGNGYSTVYAHLQTIDVKSGEKVNLATKIGEVGNTGVSVSAHLHYEVRKNGYPVNPVDYLYRDLSDAEFDQLIELASR